MKAVYKTPVVKTERVEMGVFGNYGSGYKRKRPRNRNRWFHWLFGL